MSRWAANNPERYEELTQKGVAKWLQHLADKEGFNYGDDVFLMMAELLLAMPSFRDQCVAPASNEVIAAEADYFSGLVDEAKERGDDLQR
jgi:hypothetical protein